MRNSNSGASATSERTENFSVGDRLLEIKIRRHNSNSDDEAIKKEFLKYSQKNVILSQIFRITQKVLDEIRSWFRTFNNPVERLMDYYYNALHEADYNLSEEEMEKLTPEEQELLTLCQRFDIEQLNVLNTASEEELRLLQLSETTDSIMTPSF